MRLIDADALDMAFTLARFNPDGSINHWGDRKDWCMNGQEVEDLIASQPTVGGWISVDDELPDAAGVGVLVNAVNRFGQDSIFIAFQGYGDFKWYTMDATKMVGDRDNSVNEAWKITHWMPILPPKEVKE